MLKVSKILLSGSHIAAFPQTVDPSVEQLLADPLQNADAIYALFDKIRKEGKFPQATPQMELKEWITNYYSRWREVSFDYYAGEPRKAFMVYDKAGLADALEHPETFQVAFENMKKIQQAWLIIYKAKQDAFQVQQKENSKKWEAERLVRQEAAQKAKELAHAGMREKLAEIATWTGVETDFDFREVDTDDFDLNVTFYGEKDGQEVSMTMELPVKVKAYAEDMSFDHAFGTEKAWGWVWDTLDFENKWPDALGQIKESLLEQIGNIIEDKDEPERD